MTELYKLFIKLRHTSKFDITDLARFRELRRREFRNELGDKKLPPKEKRIIQNGILGYDLSCRMMKIDENILRDIFICEAFVKREIEQLKENKEINDYVYKFFMATEEDQADLIYYLYLLSTNQTEGGAIEDLLRNLLAKDLYPESLPEEIYNMNIVQLRGELVQRGRITA